MSSSQAGPGNGIGKWGRLNDHAEVTSDQQISAERGAESNELMGDGIAELRAGSKEQGATS